MSTLSLDTHPAVEHRQLAILAGLPAWRKIELIGGLNRLLSTMAWNGLRLHYPEVSEATLWKSLDRQRLGTELAQQIEQARLSRDIKPDKERYMAGDSVPTILAVTTALDRLGVPYIISGAPLPAGSTERIARQRTSTSWRTCTTSTSTRS